MEQREPDAVATPSEIMPAADPSAMGLVPHNPAAFAPFAFQQNAMPSGLASIHHQVNHPEQAIWDDPLAIVSGSHSTSFDAFRDFLLPQGVDVMNGSMQTHPECLRPDHLGQYFQSYDPSFEKDAFEASTGDATIPQPIGGSSQPNVKREPGQLARMNGKAVRQVKVSEVGGRYLTTCDVLVDGVACDYEKKYNTKKAAVQVVSIRTRELFRRLSLDLQ